MCRMPPLMEVRDMLSRTRAVPIVLALNLAFALVAMSGCTAPGADTPSEAECNRMRAHVIDLQIARESKPDEARRAAALAAHRRIRVAANSASAVARCQSDLSAEHVACALGASTFDQYRACGKE